MIVSGGGGDVSESKPAGAADNPARMRDTQYRDSSKLARRANIHKYGSAKIGWFDWIAQEARLPADAEVLDVGCGPGWMWTAGGFPHGLSLTLTDFSEGMVREAVPRVAGLGRYRAVEGRVADAAALPFADQSFDAVLACHMLYHVPDPGRAIDEMIRVLRPGGIVAITTNGSDNMSEMYALAHAAWGGSAIDPGGAGFGIEAAETALKARLAEVQVATHLDQLRVTDGEDIVAVLTSYPPGEDAGEAQIETLQALIAARMAEHGGVFPIHKRQGLVRGRKAGQWAAAKATNYVSSG